MENIEELLRDAFRAGMNKGSHQSYFDAPLDETEYIDSIKDKLKLFINYTHSCTELSEKTNLIYNGKDRFGQEIWLNKNKT